MTSHLPCSIMVSVSVILFEAGASDSISHTFDFVACTETSRLFEGVRAEAQVYISNSHC